MRSKVLSTLAPFAPTVTGLGLSAFLVVDAVRTSPLLCAALGDLCGPVERAPLVAPFSVSTPLVALLAFTLLGGLLLAHGRQARVACCVVALVGAAAGLWVVAAQLWTRRLCIGCATADMTAFAAGGSALRRLREGRDVATPRVVRAGCALLATAAGGLVAAALFAQARIPSVLRDPHRVAEGKALFATHCIVCHRFEGGGKMGPNLTDSAWIHGGSPEQIFAEVTNGTPNKGMVQWGPLLGAERVMKLTAFVLSIKNTNVPGGKVPQGSVEE